MERLTKDGSVLHYNKQYFTNEKEAKIFAQEHNGKIYDADFLGGYEVVFQVNTEGLSHE